MDSVLEYLRNYKYLAMFTILFLCGLGLPIPEEVTLIASGLFVGWKEADFLYSSIACVSAILAGDSVIFLLGKHYGPGFLNSRPMKRFFSPRRQRKVRRLFQRNANKAVFSARFFALIRIGMYAYAGAHGMSLFRFLLLDLLGALISGPTSIWLGKFAAEQFADSPAEAARKAQEWSRDVHHLVVLGAAFVLLLLVTLWYVRRRRRRERAETIEISSPPSNPGREDRRGA